MGARESLNGRKNMARRKIRTARRAPGDNVLQDKFQTDATILASDWAEKKFSGTNQKPELWRPFGTGLVRHCPQGLFSLVFLFFVPYFSTRLDFPLPLLSAPGSPRMLTIMILLSLSSLDLDH